MAKNGNERSIEAKQDGETALEMQAALVMSVLETGELRRGTTYTTNNLLFQRQDHEGLLWLGRKNGLIMAPK